MRRKTEREIKGTKVFKFNYEKEELINPFRCTNGNLYYKDTFWWTNDGYLIKVIEYYDSDHILIEFLYNGCRLYVRLNMLKYGQIRNPYHPNNHGGYIGIGEYKSNSEHIKIYGTWLGMLYRNTLEGQISNKRVTAYSNCSVYKEWYNYQNFALWYDTYRSLLNPEYWNILELDKDVLQWNQEYKIYGPDTCCLIPKEINISLNNMHTKFTINKGLPVGVQSNEYGGYISTVSIKGESIYCGHYDTPEEAFKVYKHMKSKYIRELADFYYKEGAIKKEIYDALYNIEILPYGY